MPQPVPRERATDEDRDLAEIINRTHQYGLRIVLEAHAHLSDFEQPVSTLCAVLEQESRLRNVVGHDAVKPPQIRAPDGESLAVTRDLYIIYRYLRDHGFGAQGIGPGQLTSAGYQNEADESGGCWQPCPNIATTAWVLARLRRTTGNWPHAFEMYNAGKVGTPEGSAYSSKVQRLQRDWFARLT